MTSPRGSRWQGGWKLPEEADHGWPQHKARERLRGLCPEHHHSLLDRSRRRGFLFENRQSWRKDQVQEHGPALGPAAAFWLRGRVELHAQHPASLRMPLTLGFPAGPAKGIVRLLRRSCLFSSCILTAAVWRQQAVLALPESSDFAQSSSDCVWTNTYFWSCWRWTKEQKLWHFVIEKLWFPDLNSTAFSGDDTTLCSHEAFGSQDSAWPAAPPARLLDTQGQGRRYAGAEAPR